MFVCQLCCLFYSKNWRLRNTLLSVETFVIHARRQNLDQHRCGPFWWFGFYHYSKRNDETRRLDLSFFEKWLLCQIRVLLNSGNAFVPLSPCTQPYTRQEPGWTGLQVSCQGAQVRGSVQLHGSRALHMHSGQRAVGKGQTGRAEQAARRDCTYSCVPGCCRQTCPPWLRH